MHEAMAIELASPWRGVIDRGWSPLHAGYGIERVRLGTSSQPKTLGRGADMPMVLGWAQCYDLRVSKGIEHNQYCH